MDIGVTPELYNPKLNKLGNVFIVTNELEKYCRLGVCRLPDYEPYYNVGFGVKASHEYDKVTDDVLKEIEGLSNIQYKFSIIIPNYNSEMWIEKCLNSVLEQTYTNYEIIFVDDISTDRSPQIAEELLLGHKVIKLKTKRFQGGARNEAIIQANGDYIIFLDSDDWLLDKRVLEIINKNLFGEDVGFLGITRYQHGEPTKTFIPEYKDRYEAFQSEWSGSCLKVVKRELAQAHLYDEGNLMEDRVHHYKMCYYMRSFINIPIATHAWNKDNLTSITTLREAKWKNTIHRHLANNLDFLSEINKNDTWYIDFMNKKIEKIKQHIKQGGDWQL